MSRAHSRCSSDTPQSAPPPHPAILWFPRMPQAPLWLMSAGQRPQRPDPLLEADCRPQHAGLGVTWALGSRALGGWERCLWPSPVAGPEFPGPVRTSALYHQVGGEHLLWGGPQGSGNGLAVRQGSLTRGCPSGPAPCASVHRCRLGVVHPSPGRAGHWGRPSPPRSA